MNRVNLDGVRELARALRLNATLATLRLEDWQDTFDNEQVRRLYTAKVHVRENILSQGKYTSAYISVIQPYLHLLLFIRY